MIVESIYLHSKKTRYLNVRSKTTMDKIGKFPITNNNAVIHIPLVPYVPFFVLND